MQTNLSKREAAKAAKAAKAAEAEAARIAAEAEAAEAARIAAEASTSEQAEPPATEAPEPAEITARARHNLLLSNALALGADPAQLRGRIKYAVAVAGPKAECRHNVGDNYLKRFGAVTDQTQSFVLKQFRAFGFEPFDCEPHDAGKLARALGNGLVHHVSGGHPTTTKTGLAAIGPIAGTPMLFAVTVPDCDMPGFNFKLPKPE